MRAALRTLGLLEEVISDMEHEERVMDEAVREAVDRDPF